MTRRRSKVRSKTRSDSSQRSEDEILYCICRTSDGTRFMIACDNCEEWYHGDCINVTPKQANNIKRFFCHLCIGRNPNLEIEYKTSKEMRPRLPNLRQQIKKTNFSSDDENDADLSSSSSPDKSLVSSKSKRAIRKRWRPSISESVGKKRRGRPKERQDDYDEEATEDEIETSGFVPSMTECVEEGGEGAYCGQEYRRSGSVARLATTRRQTVEVGRVSGLSKAAQRTFGDGNYTQDSLLKMCGNCEGCKMTTDCGRCDVCQRFGSSAMARSCCRKRRCQRIDYRGQSRKTYHLAKEYDNIIDEDFDTVADEPEYHRPGNIRRKCEIEIDDIRQRLSNPTNSSKDTCAVGSKMRRGDHLPGGGNSTAHRRGLPNTGMPYKCHGEATVEVVNRSPYRYQHPQGANNNRLSRHQSTHPSQPLRRARNQSDAAQMSSNTSSVSGPMSSHQYQYADDSDEDVMIPGELISPTNGQRLPDSDSRNISNYHHLRPGKATVNIDTRNHHYGLNYPDHLYCKHHRSFDWHGTVPGDNTMCSGDGGLGTTRSESSSSLKPSEAELDARLRSPVLDHHQQLSPGGFMVIDRSMKTGRLSANDHHHRQQQHKPHKNTVVTLVSDSSQAYQMVDLNQQQQQPMASGPVVTDNITKQAHNKDPLSSSLSAPRSSSSTTTTSNTSVFLKASLAANAQTQEFYTINDEDDLEINWPKETVNV